MSDHSRDVKQSFEKGFQKDTLKEFELIDPSFLAHVDDIMSELGLIEDAKPNASSSVTLTRPETEKMLPRLSSPDLSSLFKELSPTVTTSTTESISPVSSPVESFLMPKTYTGTMQNYPFSEDFALSSDLQFLETIELPTSSKAEPSLQLSRSSADCLSQGTISYSPPTIKTSSGITSKPVMKTRNKKRTHDLKAKKYDGLNEEQTECKRLKVNAQCHLSIDILEEADRHNITLFCLPSNTTHELQPLDTAVFRSFEYRWDQEVLNFWRNRPQRSLSKDVFGKVFIPVWTKCMTMANIQSGFRKCGIYPFNKDAIPEHAFAPSEVTQMDVATSDDAPPQPSTSQDNPTYPLTSQDAPPQSSTSQDAPLQPSTSQCAPPQPSTSQCPPPQPSTSQGLLSQPSINQGPPTQPSTTQGQSPRQSIVSTPSSTSGSPHLDFNLIMEKPIKTKKKTVTRAKSINYRATVISKSLFESNTNSKSGKGKGKGVGKGKGKKSKGSKAKPTIKDSEEEWFCPGCGENEQEDMRRCESCGVWYHENYVGLTKDDDTFVCPQCDA
ncbi:tigger transposable element-derived protein 1-like [Plakobranchus ocellatus]|uniref:Tigger transposable element-derived protein 1-like n=1 Tax=Plakobranchus ocellatus TaxID=259542 RepID=A0AAV4DG86_9GAST|nr:tigger transposable element-derived protein 1-like [Plakobranchus ocellatus]